MQNYTRALCFVALVAMATTVFSDHAAARYIGMVFFFLSWSFHSYFDTQTYIFLVGYMYLYYAVCTDTDLCTPVEYCSPPVRASGNIACKANCVNRGYDKDKSSCLEGSSGTWCCGKNWVPWNEFIYVLEIFAWRWMLILFVWNLIQFIQSN